MWLLFDPIDRECWEAPGCSIRGRRRGIPIVTMPCVNAAYVRHTQFEQSVSTLRSLGVRVLYGEGGFVPNEPGQGRPDAYPWHLALDAARELVEERG